MLRIGYQKSFVFDLYRLFRISLLLILLNDEIVLNDLTQMDWIRWMRARTLGRMAGAIVIGKWIRAA